MTTFQRSFVKVVSFDLPRARMVPNFYHATFNRHDHLVNGRVDCKYDGVIHFDASFTVLVWLRRLILANTRNVKLKQIFSLGYNLIKNDHLSSHVILNADPLWFGNVLGHNTRQTWLTFVCLIVCRPLCTALCLSYPMFKLDLEWFWNEPTWNCIVSLNDWHRGFL